MQVGWIPRSSATATSGMFTLTTIGSEQAATRSMTVPATSLAVSQFAGARPSIENATPVRP